MKFLILGAGGIGCYYGARLLQAGHDVVMVARGEHLRALQQTGLRVTHPAFEYAGPVTVCALEAVPSLDVACVDWVLLTAKAGATQSMLASLADWLQAAAVPVLSLQNGVDNERQIAAVVGQARTAGGLAVRIGGHILAPGVVEATGVAQIEMGAWPDCVRNPLLQPRLQQLCEILIAAGIPATLTDNIERALWRKLVINNGVNPLSALTGLDTRALTSDPVLGKVVYQLMDETGRAANAEGVDIGRADVDAMFRLISEFDAIKTSMLVDREKGRPMEIDDICGPVIRGCLLSGQAAHITAMVRSLLLFNSGFCQPFRLPE